MNPDKTSQTSGTPAASGDTCPGAASTSIECLMTKGVVTISMDRSVEEAKALFDEGALHHLVVLERGAVVGVVSDRDVLRWISPFVGKMSEKPRDLALLKRPIHQIMSRGVVTIDPDECIEAAAGRFLRHRVGCLPVTNDQGALVGVLTWRDVMRWLGARAGVPPEPGAPIRCSRFEPNDDLDLDGLDLDAEADAA